MGWKLVPVPIASKSVRLVPPCFTVVLLNWTRGAELVVVNCAPLGPNALLESTSKKENSVLPDPTVRVASVALMKGSVVLLVSFAPESIRKKS